MHSCYNCVYRNLDFGTSGGEVYHLNGKTKLLVQLREDMV